MSAALKSCLILWGHLCLATHTRTARLCTKGVCWRERWPIRSALERPLTWPSGPPGRLIETDRPRLGLLSELPFTAHPSSLTTAIQHHDNKAVVCTDRRTTSRKQQDLSQWVDEGNRCLDLGICGWVMYFMPATDAIKNNILHLLVVHFIFQKSARH